MHRMLIFEMPLRNLRQVDLVERIQIEKALGHDQWKMRRDKRRVERPGLIFTRRIAQVLQRPRLDQVIDLVARVTPDVSAPIVLFTYYNPIYQRGFEPFVKKIAAAGAKGLLVPDIPLEETGELSAVCKANGLDLVLLSTPTTPEERMAKIAEKSNGFIYLVSVTGVTGVRSGVESRVEGLVKSLKSVTDKPVAVGFGISKREQAAEVVQWGADGVIVGSALVKALGEAKTPEDGLAALKELAVELREGSNREGAKRKGSGGGFFARLMGKA